MELERAFLVSGTVLLAASALAGFVQHRYRNRDAFARWRVVHAGGTAGAVQLLALSGVWARFDVKDNWGSFLVAGLILATWAFFLGPLASALDAARTARTINIVGASLAFPAYLALPVVLF